ncbi:hypothetical protein BVRB_2g040230 [Beta vulgaris subsp. vulgaris]|uniref:uncharacterized protein LOC104887313 n=1 Tax=Beta vulgaris subsp. vulgaris TaxID=3555 RepID=UPI0005401C38|nr:uncharacterized protein LOC104887313 [Beta vulgaris subsp. vulgaris]KMT17332.1 hypothetical protein BVRB_2g040230 [Beta vulgaris subsp. vulgaris]
MGEIGAKHFLGVNVNHTNERKPIRGNLLSQAVTKFKLQQPIRIKCQSVNQRPSTYSSRISTDIAMYETPGASFDQYLEDTPRVFKAIFPDKRRSQQLNEEEWRVHMLPIQFFFLTVMPVVDMRLRCTTNGKNYPSGIPPTISKVLELNIVRWELQGLDNVLDPNHFDLGVHGSLYSDRRGVRSRLKGQLELKISVVLPPVLGFIPEDVCRSVSESVLKGLVENMKDKVNGSLLADYSKFRRERQMNPV